MQIQMLTRPFMNSYLCKFEELTDERIDQFLQEVIDTIDYIKEGGNNGSTYQD